MYELESKRKKFTQRLARLKKIENKIQEKELRLSGENSNKTRLLDSIRQSKEFKLTKLKNLRAKKSRLFEDDDSGVLDLLFQPSLFEQKGKLPYPVKGSIAQGFGIVRDSTHNVSWAHKGIFISAEEGSKVSAIFDGHITYVGELPGFGRTIIIDHGDHYYSTYAHQKNIFVSEGMAIRQNHVISEVGRRQDFGDTGIYFEIRHFSEPTDPRKWLKGKPL